MIYHSAEKIQKEKTGAAGRVRPLHQQLCSEQSMLVTQGTGSLELGKEHFSPSFCSYLLFTSKQALASHGQESTHR